MSGVSPATSRRAMALAWRALSSHRPSVEVGVELGRQQAHLGQQMAAALAAELEVARQLGIEEDHGLGRHRAVLGGAEAQHVDARLPRQLGRRAADEGQRIGEARAVHVQLQPMAMRRGGDGGDLLGRIDGAALGRLGDADGGGLREMHARRRPAGPAPGRASSDRSCRPAPSMRNSLAPAGVELRRVGLLGRDVRRRMAEDRAPRRRAAGQRQARWRRCRWRPERPPGRACRTARAGGARPSASSRRRRRRGRCRCAEGAAHGLDDRGWAPASLSLRKFML